jgi:pilus assembly protein Flp/PilA
MLRLPFPSILALLVEGSNMTRIFKLLRDNRGATAIEYGLIAALIAVAAITAMTSIGTKLSTTFNNVSSNLG